MKKITFLAFSLLFAMQTYSQTQINGIWYNFSGTSAEVTYGIKFPTSTTAQYTGTITIPEQVVNGGKTYNVTGIGSYAFAYCSNLNSVIIPNSVVTIGSSAFSDCSRLSAINIPNSVTSIESFAFFNCYNLTSITIPNSVTNISTAIFYKCTGLNSIMVDAANPNYSSLAGVLYNKNQTTLIQYPIGKQGAFTIPNSVTHIGTYAFYYCYNLSSITIPNSVTNIGNNAFAECSSLQSISIPNSITNIGNDVFAYCSGLKSVSIPNSVTNIGDDAFYNCSGLTSLTIPRSVTHIGFRAFSSCNSLTTITIPDSVTNIGNSAFYGCSSLTSITIPRSVTSIGGEAFSNCSNLKTLYFNADSCITMGIYGSPVFKDCTNLKNLNIGNNVRSIPDYAFYSCDSLTSVTIPNSVTHIGADAFYNCRSLTSLTIPRSVSIIGGWAFGNCNALKTLYFNADNCISAEYPGWQFITKLIIGDNVKNIPDYAFTYCNFDSVTIGNSVLNIGQGAFEECDSLRFIIISNSITNIGDNVFSYCEKLNTVMMGNSVTNIGKSAFEGCDSLKSITIPNTVTNIGDYAFWNCKKLKTLYFNADACIYAKAQWDSLTTVTIGNNVRFIPSYIFYNCTRLTAITMPNSVTNIGAAAFYNCSGLASLTIPNAVAIIGNSAFAKCTKLTSLSIPNSVVNIGDYAFEECTGLSSALIIGNSVTNIGKGAFDGCRGLSSITLGNSVENIGDYAFDGCSGLSSITIPKSVTYIGSYAFNYCTNLKTLYFNADNCTSAYARWTALTMAVIGNNVKTIPGGIFYDCTNLTSIIIPDSVTRIESAFRNCSNLNTVRIGKNMNSMGEYTFQNCSNLKYIYVKNATPAMCGKETFLGVPHNICVLYIPYGSYTLYSKATGWKDFVNITEYYLTITAKVNTGGSISPVGDSITTYNSTIKYTFSANQGYIVDSLLIDGINVSDSIVVGSYTFHNITSNHSISVSFKSVGGVAVTGISLNKNELTLKAGATETLQATIIPSNATNQNINWTSTNPDVATVANGIVTALAEGSTTITATTVDGGKIASCNVTVTLTTVVVTGISLNKSTLNLKINDSETLMATISPSNATNQNINWTSTNPDIATVTNGLVTALAEGSTTIIATTVDGGKVATCNVTVTLTAISVTGISLNKSILNLKVNDSETLIATLTPSNATNQNINWTSTNPDIATVANGLVTALAEGNTTIIATTVDGGKVATCNVTVSKNGSAITDVYTVQGSFKVYPNPVTSQLQIETYELGIEQISIYDVSGKLMGVYAVTDKKTTIDVSSLSKGVYFIKAGNATKRVVKQ